MDCLLQTRFKIIPQHFYKKKKKSQLIWEVHNIVGMAVLKKGGWWFFEFLLMCCECLMGSALHADNLQT